MPNGDPLPLHGTLAYQPDSIVSRVLLKRAGGSVTLFAFDADQELSEHSTPFDALLQVVDGEAEVRIAGHAHRLSAGQVIHMPADVPHAVKAVTRVTLVLVMVKDGG
jgi:quercetin dioxygenase-like cupin family protein